MSSLVLVKVRTLLDTIYPCVAMVLAERSCHGCAVANLLNDFQYQATCPVDLQRVRLGGSTGP
jgi:hypothetical protein